MRSAPASPVQGSSHEQPGFRYHVCMSGMSIPEAFALAFQYHQAGQLAPAEQLYCQILDVEPNHADALQLLGEIAYRCGHNESARELISKAVQLNPQAAPYY